MSNQGANQKSTNQSDKAEKEPPVPSPCVSICALDDDDICIGCHRSGDEISQWGYQSNEWKRDVLKKTHERWQKP